MGYWDGEPIVRDETSYEKISSWLEKQHLKYLDKVAEGDETTTKVEDDVEQDQDR